MNLPACIHLAPWHYLHTAVRMRVFCPPVFYHTLPIVISIFIFSMTESPCGCSRIGLSFYTTLLWIIFFNQLGVLCYSHKGFIWKKPCCGIWDIGVQLSVYGIGKLFLLYSISSDVTSVLASLLELCYRSRQRCTRQHPDVSRSLSEMQCRWVKKEDYITAFPHPHRVRKKERERDRERERVREKLW